MEDIAKTPIYKRHEILQKQIFELNNQEKIFKNPNISFESFVKPIVNKPKSCKQ